MYLYEYDVPCDYFIIILDGNATLKVGQEGMEINAGLFSYYGINALVEENDKNNNNTNSTSTADLTVDNDSKRKLYKPEFSLIVNSYCVYLKVTREAWKDAVKKSIIERLYHHNGLPNVKTNEFDLKMIPRTKDV